MAQDKFDFKADFLRRINETKRSRWMRFDIVMIIFFLWVGWLGTWWVALFSILLFDIYITGYIPLTWWKNSKNTRKFANKKICKRRKYICFKRYKR